MKKMLLWLPFCCLLLTACGTVTKTRIEKVSIPTSLLTCSEFPKAPQEQDMMQSDVAKYNLKLWDALDDCKSKLNQVRVILKED